MNMAQQAVANLIPADVYPSAKYLLVARPHADLCEKIAAIRQQFARNYDGIANVKGRVEMGLLHFEQYLATEMHIVHRMRILLAQQPPFMAEIENYGSLPAHTIFFQVRTQEAVKRLQQALRPVQALLKPDILKKPHFFQDPHIVLARNLLAWQYEKGWLEMQNSAFTGRWVTTRLWLLRKREEDRGYQPVAEFPLLHKETQALNQAVLF
jgi:hypothetical protein